MQCTQNFESWHTHAKDWYNSWYSLWHLMCIWDDSKEVPWKNYHKNMSLGYVIRDCTLTCKVYCDLFATSVCIFFSFFFLIDLYIQDYQFSILHTTVTISSWRQLLAWLGPPGLAIAALSLLTLDEPRKPTGNFLGDVFSSSKFTSSATRDLNRSQASAFNQLLGKKASK